MSVLNQPTLVLNKSWTAIDSTTVKEALCNVMAERATFLDADYMQHDISSWMRLPVVEGKPFIRTVQSQIRVPEIMLLTEYSKIPVRKVVFCRRNLWRRDRTRCQYCGKEPPIDEITIDHICPKSRGGESTFENCVLCCISCNLKKGNKSLQAAGMRLQRLKRQASGKWATVYYSCPKRPLWNPLYTLRRKTFPKSWATFLKSFDDALYWEVELER